MRQFIDRVLGGGTAPIRGPVTIAPALPTRAYEDDLAIEVKMLSVEQYMVHLCRLIAREGQDQPLRRNYEQMLRKLQLLLEREAAHAA